MSKVISFSISDRYLDKLRSLYPDLTDNLAAKQFLTDRLSNSLDVSLDDGLDDRVKSIIETSLSSSLDDTLGDVLDDKLKAIIETSLDGILDERLDAVMGKLISSLSERIERLEERLDTNLDGGLDDKLDYGLPYQPTKNELTETQRRVLESRQLAEAKLKHAAYLVKHPLVVRDLSKKQPIETAIESVEAADKVESVDESGTSPLPNQENVENDSTTEPVTDAIEDLPKVETVSTDSSIEPDAIASVTGNGMTSAAAHRFLISKNVKIAPRSLDNWIRDSKISKSRQGKEAQEYIYIKDKKYYAIE